MSSEEIPVGNVIYVSSRRASEMSGYAQDYIGQLARSGQIQAKRVGGLWYVYMESLDSYKIQSSDLKSIPAGNIKNTNTGDLESNEAVLFDGKEYISAKRASNITGYNQDYVGQLARSGKILSRQVGNRWYVDHDGILAHKKEKDSLLAAVQSESVGILRPKEGQINVLPATLTAIPSLMTYVSDNGDLRPSISSIEDRNDALGARKSRFYAESSEASLADLDQEEYQVPVQIIRRTVLPPKPIRMASNRSKSRNSKADSNGSQVISLSLSISILALILFISAGLLVYTRVGNRFGITVPDQLSMSANAITAYTKAMLEPIEDAFENLVVPELVYQRSR